ncbi:Alg9-like mannosyltransferase family-domain-containing protein [Neurospora hispaniola]|uniref:Mannosyltransferase n=1 Tax=Neurospora hispaniola TaxID=588809 RepID=A0AAJ0IA41_9PEZI|nr:Alg9-like mannosyltransferase family-domain-containing protein [Neurospora hispaniola]
MPDEPAISKPTEAERANTGDVKTPKTSTPATRPHRHVVSAQVYDVLTLLFVFRFINALILRTFFQPDEYFQALEPAWNMAFGDQSGAWLTWEWQHQLRSSLHPAIFGLAYKAAHWILSALFPPAFEMFVLEALPKLVQSVFAALCDFYTWQLATSIFGDESNVPWTALWMTVLNPWQWYCSTRTFSNSLETTLTIAALYYWPWDLVQDAKSNKQEPLQIKDNLGSLRVSLILAAVAVLLRPTNLLIWLGVLTLTVTRLTLDGESPINRSTLLVLVKEIIVCGSAVLAVSLISDRLYFGFWTFPPYKWLYFNISQSLAVFYGHMPWHYYLSQGIPLLTTTFLPFALVGLYKATSSSRTLTVLQSNILKTLSFAVLSMVGTLSIISHKEVRFIYPLLPILHILAAPYVFKFFTIPATSATAATTTQTKGNAAAPSSPTTTGPVTLRHKISLANLLSLNLLLAIYLSLFHQPAALSVMTFLRAEFERIHPDSLSLDSSLSQKQELFALFLTPCHSTPWRSHLAYPALRARALTCEPPLHTQPGSEERRDYMDEADRFYKKSEEEDGLYGVEFLREEMWGGDGLTSGGGTQGEEIPRYIVGFEGIEESLKKFFEEDKKGKEMGIELNKVWEGWNGAFNEDWRRRGKLVVWNTGVYDELVAEQKRSVF